MDDKEIGKLWKVNQIPILKADDLHNGMTAAIFLLILSLVEERANWNYNAWTGPLDMLALRERAKRMSLETALEDFGIDYQEYLTVKEATKK